MFSASEDVVLSYEPVVQQECKYKLIMNNATLLTEIIQ